MQTFTILEFDTILEKLAENALSAAVKQRCVDLQPTLDEAEAGRWMEETTQAKRLIEQTGTPPLASMSGLEELLHLIDAGAMLLPEQILHVLSFLISCRRMKTYLEKAERTGINIAWYGKSIDPLAELENEIERCIRNGAVEDRASAQLYDIRRQISLRGDQIKAKLNVLLQKNKAWFSEDFISVKNGHYTLPVKREHKNDIAGTVIAMSHTERTCFIEPSSVSKWEAELSRLQIEEDEEVRRILYTLTACIADVHPAIKLDMETMETLDFLFAKGKLSLFMHANPVHINADRKLSISNARHPLLDPGSAVPLNFSVGESYTGVVITGPNTGGKTVALKTIGLLSLMAQSGLHVPADAASSFCMQNMVLCDIGDGQSITENLSTFSAHMKNVIEILQQADEESLVLLDELGSGTDPTEGMGLAVAILDALCAKECLFAVTTHYPEIKGYAAHKPGLVNARMAFDKESLLPLYHLEIGEAGESCALYIAQRLGMPRPILARAQEAAYGNARERPSLWAPESMPAPESPSGRPRIIKKKEQPPKAQSQSGKFHIGDSVLVYPDKKIGIVYAPSNEKGQVGVQIQGKKKLINHKRIKLHVAAGELYPEDYDFSILFDSVKNRKAQHIMGKRHEEGNISILKEGDKEK